MAVNLRYRMLYSYSIKECYPCSMFRKSGYFCIAVVNNNTHATVYSPQGC